MKGMRRNLQRDIMGSIIHRYTPASTHLVDLVSVLLWPALEKKRHQSEVSPVMCLKKVAADFRSIFKAVIIT